MKIKPPVIGGLGQEFSEAVFAQLSVFWGLSHLERGQFLGILQHQSHASAQAF